MSYTPKEIVTMIAICLCVYYLLKQLKLRRNANRLKKIILAPPTESEREVEQNQPQLSTSELIAQMETEQQKTTSSVSSSPVPESEGGDFEDAAIRRLKLVVTTMKQLQLRLTNQVYNTDTVEFGSGEAAIEQQSLGNNIAMDDGDNNYKTLWAMAEREFKLLQLTAKGRQYVTDTFAVGN